MTRVWDLPTRLFHWLTAAAVTGSIVTVKLGGSWMDWHTRCGYLVLGLVTFRILWGFAGPRYARFSDFVRGPRAVLAYLADSRAGRAARHAGHNPLGALSVLALLGVLLAQATTGLFTSDEVAVDGPLVKIASEALSRAATRLHHMGEKALFALVVLHLLAIAWYRFARGERLATAMITGAKPLAAPATEDDAGVRMRAAVLAAVASALVGFLVTL